MKTIKEWFETLPEEYREKALKGMVNGDSLQDSMAAALSNGLIWQYTTDGKKYWAKVFDKYLQDLIIKDIKEEKI